MNIIVTRCKWCGELLFDGAGERQPRSDKQFCTSVHRARYHQWLRAIKKHEATATKSIKALAEYLQHPAAQATALESMVRLSELMAQEQAWAGVKAVR